MSYEFKRLSDVEAVAEPAESANVLIEENGVIKKAPKTAVGGMGGSLMVNVMAGEIPSFDRTYDEIKEVLDNGGVVLLSGLSRYIAEQDGFAPDMVINTSWPLYYGMLVQYESEGEIIVFVPTVATGEVFYLRSDNAFITLEPSSGAPE